MHRNDSRCSCFAHKPNCADGRSALNGRNAQLQRNALQGRSECTGMIQGRSNGRNALQGRSDSCMALAHWLPYTPLCIGLVQIIRVMRARHSDSQQPSKGMLEEEATYDRWLVPYAVCRRTSAEAVYNSRVQLPIANGM